MKCVGTEDLKQSLVREKEMDAARIPYRFTISEKYPQYVIMGYIPKKDNVLIREFIKVKPRGYFFHHQYHYPFQNMINWFKKEFNTVDYKRYVKKAQSPQQVVGAPVPPPVVDNYNNMMMKGGGMDIQQETNWAGAPYGMQDNSKFFNFIIFDSIFV